MIARVAAGIGFTILVIALAVDLLGPTCWVP